MSDFNKLHTAGCTALVEATEADCSFVFTNGCFDVLHPGHVRFLRWLREGFIGDNHKRKLVIGLNSDDSVKAAKGPSRPFHSLVDRAFVLEATGLADIIVPFDESTPYELIKYIKPDVLAKGGDYTGRDIIGGPLVRSYGGLVVFGPLTQNFSTTRCLDALEGKLDILRTVHGLLLGEFNEQQCCTKCGTTNTQVDALDIADAILNDRKNCTNISDSGMAVLRKHFGPEHRIWKLWSENGENETDRSPAAEGVKPTVAGTAC